MKNLLKIIFSFIILNTVSIAQTHITTDTEWLIGTWETSKYDDVEFKLKINPTSNPSIYMFNEWLTADEPIEVYGNTLIYTRNEVDMQFTVDKGSNIIYMGDGKTKLRKIGTNSSSRPASNNGKYVYDSSGGTLTVTISGSSWQGKTVIKTGFGSAYDNQQAQYSRGIVNGNDLYDESGYIKVGYVSGNRVSMDGYSLYKK